MKRASKDSESAKMGRPSLRTPELDEEICKRLESGEALASICRDEHMPTNRTVQLWVEGDEQLSSRYTRARKIGLDVIANRLRDTARGLGDSQGDVARDKLIIDTDLKLLACWDRERYGTQRIEHGGELSVKHDESALITQANALLAKMGA